MQIAGFVGSVSARARPRWDLRGAAWLGFGATTDAPEGLGPRPGEPSDRHRQLVPAGLGSPLRNKALEAELADVVKAGRRHRRGREPAAANPPPGCKFAQPVIAVTSRGAASGLKPAHVLETGPGQRELAMRDGISRVNAILGLILTIGMIAMGVAGLNPTGGSYAATQVSANVDASN